jgi:hypothetical protein
MESRNVESAGQTEFPLEIFLVVDLYPLLYSFSFPRVAETIFEPITLKELKNLKVRKPLNHSTTTLMLLNSLICGFIYFELVKLNVIFQLVLNVAILGSGFLFLATTLFLKSSKSFSFVGLLFKFVFLFSALD